ncbi:hypothetical protein BD311DRAFT_258308 [Dichomitus squalens]|uniref:Uncharacterized protein n=1 Tax=Dichomitus squalens TaxID=114155 RepID=A0A4Q9MTT7_9APHY|nr:hypothetical protein BD311DRAFT_258308 [Dichomitus squalens]
MCPINPWFARCCCLSSLLLFTVLRTRRRCCSPCILALSLGLCIAFRQQFLPVLLHFRTEYRKPVPSTPGVRVHDYSGTWAPHNRAQCTKRQSWAREATEKGSAQATVQVAPKEKPDLGRASLSACSCSGSLVVWSYATSTLARPLNSCGCRRQDARIERPYYTRLRPRYTRLPRLTQPTSATLPL